MLQPIKRLRNSFSRRSVLRNGLAAPVIIGAQLGDPLSSRAFSGGVTLGDISILRFLAALEIIEHDLWEQYNELCGVQDTEVPNGIGNPAFAAAVNDLDPDMSRRAMIARKGSAAGPLEDCLGSRCARPPACGRDCPSSGPALFRRSWPPVSEITPEMTPG